jgi:hypothetical protein
VNTATCTYVLNIYTGTEENLLLTVKFMEYNNYCIPIICFVIDVIQCRSTPTILY